MIFRLRLVVALFGLNAALVPAQAQYVGPDEGQRVAFVGDSITQLGWDNPVGYLHLVDMALAREGHKIQVIPAGISGQTSKDMLARIGDVLAKKPDWMLLSCGVNDVWHGVDGVPLDLYKINITAIVDRARAAGARVVILAATPIGFNLTDDNNTKLGGYNDFLRGLAAQDKLLFIDLNKAMAEGSANAKKQAPHEPGDTITLDGVHPNGFGFEIMATGILKAWGFTEAQLAQVSAGWEQLPVGISFQTIFNSGQGVTLHDYRALRASAETQNKAVKDVLLDPLTADVKKIVEAAPPAPTSP